MTRSPLRHRSILTFIDIVGTLSGMDMRFKLLAEARDADIERHVATNRTASLAATCRRWLLGVIPVERPCGPTA